MKLQMSVTFTPLSDPNSSEHQEKNNDDRQDNIERIHDRPHGFPYAKPLPIVSLGIRPKDAITVLAILSKLTLSTVLYKIKEIDAGSAIAELSPYLPQRV